MTREENLKELFEMLARTEDDDTICEIYRAIKTIEMEENNDR